MHVDPPLCRFTALSPSTPTSPGQSTLTTNVQLSAIYCHFYPAGQFNSICPHYWTTVPVSGTPIRQLMWTWLKGSKNLLPNCQLSSGMSAITISWLSLADLCFQPDASSRSYSCVTAFYLATWLSPHPTSYLILPLLSNTHTTCLLLQSMR